MSKTVQPFSGLAEEHEAAATPVVREAVQCTDTDNMNYMHEDSIYTTCEKEMNYIKKKSRLVI